MKKRALLSVSDKRDIVYLATELLDLGYELISTGGTYEALVASGLAVTKVSEVTGFPEILDGRVKTLHPLIHGGILAKRSPDHEEQCRKLGIGLIDVVAVNLYPFEETVANPQVTRETAIENIDIGGPSMLRSAAKNHSYVSILVRPEQYRPFVAQLKETNEIDAATRLLLAREAFAHTARYDALITSYLSKEMGETMPHWYQIQGEKRYDLRYGENPQQQAAFYATENQGLAVAVQHGGKELSFNNLMDLQAALDLVREFEKPACVIIKHTNPCGAALGASLLEAYQKAYEADPVSAYGSIVGFNGLVDEKTAQELAKLFVEAVLAPGYTKEALLALQQKKSLRIMEVPLHVGPEEKEIKKVTGGFLLQTKDGKAPPPDFDWVHQEELDDTVEEDLLFAWTLVKHVKSNAIVVVKNNVSVGIGPGQTNRVGAAKIALEMAGDEAIDSVLASDAFFPFRDTVDLAAEYGVRAIVQPGGSIRDEDSIAACQEKHVAMAFTGRRHFKH